MMSRSALLMLVVLVASACGKPGSSGEYVKQIEAWRAKHEADYRKEYVGLAGLFFLKPGPNKAGSAAGNDVVLPPSAPGEVGTFLLDGANNVRFEPGAPGLVTLNGKSVDQPIDLKSDAAKPGPDELTVGSVAMWVHPSGDRRAIRLRDEQGEMARSFAGFHWFPIDPKYRIVAKFTKDTEPPRQVKVPTLTGDYATYTTEGTVEFQFEGQTIHMRPMTTRPKRLFLIFRDGTSGHETYAAARFLYADLNDDGTTVLDFNEAYNPPCSFNAYTTCPLPPPENRLSIRLPVGEKDYPNHPAHLTP